MKRVFVVLVASVLLAACGGDGGDSDETTTTTAADTATTRGTGATTTSLPRGEVTPLASAQALLDAWQAADAKAADRVAEVPAVQSLFKTPYSSSSGLSGLQYRGCAANSAFQNAMTCSYQYDGGSMHMIMSQTGTLWRVNRIEYIAD